MTVVERARQLLACQPGPAFLPASLVHYRALRRRSGAEVKLDT